MKTKVITGLVIMNAFCYALAPGCRTDDGMNPDGSEGGDCYPNGTCNAGLACKSGLCVEDGDGTADPGEVLDNCLECGRTTCASEAEECDAAGGCGELIACWAACMDDVSCVNACDPSAVTAEDLQLVNQYFLCISTNCMSECTASPVGPDDSEDTGGGEVCASEGVVQGSCATGSLEICEDGVWRAASCQGCDILTPSTTCERVHAFALEEQGTDLVSVIPTQLTFEQSAEAVSAEWYIEAGQMGVIQFVFSAPVDPSRIDISYNGDIEFVTLELPGGADGCQYEVASSGRLERYLIIGSSGVDWYGCWGDFASYTMETPGTLTVLSIRTPIADTNETVSLTIYGILL